MAACIDGTSNTMIVSEIADYFFINSSAATVPGTRIRIDGSVSGTTVANSLGGRWFVGCNANPVASSTTSLGSNQVYNLTTIRPQSVNNANYTIGFNGKSLKITGTNSGLGMNRGINNPLISAHPNVVLAVFMDGHTQGLQKTLHAAILKRLATRDDGQQIADF
jgi:hypothetical protein